MPLFYKQNIHPHTRLAIWEIKEQEAFFLQKVTLQSSITHPHKRLQHLAGRYLLSHLFPNFPQHEIDIATTRKPFLPQEQYHFSISHCGQYAAAIVSSQLQVGIDIELPRQTIVTVAPKFLNYFEENLLSHYPLTQRQQVLTIIWCAKEAIFKWWGLGEVDFSKMITIEKIETDGTILAIFKKNEMCHSLRLQYQWLHNLCMVWVQ